MFKKRFSRVQCITIVTKPNAAISKCSVCCIKKGPNTGLPSPLMWCKYQWSSTDDSFDSLTHLPICDPSHQNGHVGGMTPN